MKIIVDIPNWLYIAIMEHHEPVYSQSLGDAVRDGTSLPKGHGRLIDADVLSIILTEQYPKNYMNEPELSGTAAHFSLRHILQILNSESCVPTIIEADKESIK